MADGEQGSRRYVNNDTATRTGKRDAGATTREELEHQQRQNSRRQTATARWEKK